MSRLTIVNYMVSCSFFLFHAVRSKYSIVTPITHFGHWAKNLFIHFAHLLVSNCKQTIAIFHVPLLYMGTFCRPHIIDYYLAYALQWPYNDHFYALLAHQWHKISIYQLNECEPLILTISEDAYANGFNLVLLGKTGLQLWEEGAENTITNDLDAFDSSHRHCFVWSDGNYLKVK